MNVRHQYGWALFAAVSMGLGTLLLTVYVNQRFVLALVGTVMACGVFILNLRCPDCGRPVALRTVDVRGARLHYWGGFTIPKACSGCGHVFDHGRRR